MITLYRIVSHAEMDDYLLTGVLQTTANSLEAKQFFKSKRAVEDFLLRSRQQDYDPAYEYLLIVLVDQDAFDAAFENDLEKDILLDGFEALSIKDEDLQRFNECLIFVESSAL